MVALIQTSKSTEIGEFKSLQYLFIFCLSVSEKKLLKSVTIYIHSNLAHINRNIYEYFWVCKVMLKYITKHNIHKILVFLNSIQSLFLFNQFLIEPPFANLIYLNSHKANKMLWGKQFFSQNITCKIFNVPTATSNPFQNAISTFYAV